MIETSKQGKIDIVVLAGDRRPSDPWVQALGVEGKALIPLGGVPLLARVLAVLGAWQGTGHVIVVAPKAPHYTAILNQATPLLEKLTHMAPESTLFESLTSALEVRGVFEKQGLIVTADHGLLEPIWLDKVTSALGPSTQLSLAMAEWPKIAKAFPEAHRTVYRFSDRQLCGGNLFAFDRRHIMGVLGFWQALEAKRKQPVKMVSMLGIRHVLRYLTRRLSTEQAFGRLTQLTGAKISPVIIDDPSVSVDIDSAEDLALAETILVQRAKMSSQAC